MSTHKIGFYEQISKIIPKYHQIRTVPLLLQVEAHQTSSYVTKLTWSEKMFAISVTLEYLLYLIEKYVTFSGQAILRYVLPGLNIRSEGYSLDPIIY